MRQTLAVALALTLCAPPTGAADLAFLAARPSPALWQPSRAAFAPRPAPKQDKPWLMSVWVRGYLADAASVGRWLLEPRDQAAPVAGWAERPAVPAPTDALYGTAEPPSADRILVKPGADMVGPAEALSRALYFADRMPRLKRLAMPWQQARGFRYRIVYLDALGATYGAARGFRIVRPGLPEEWAAARVPQALRRPAPIYFRGMTVPFAVELEAFEDLSGLAVSTRQEELDGLPLTEFKRLGTLTLKSGQRRVLRGSTPLLSTREDGPVNFERTHLIAGVEGEESLRVDAPEAGLVDPPGN